MSNRAGYLAGVVVGVAAVLPGCVSRGDYDALQQVADNQARVIRDLKTYNHDLQLKYDRATSDDPLRDEKLARTLEQLKIYKERTAQLEEDLRKRFLGGPVVAGVTVEKWGLRVASAVLFDSGRHTLKASGKAALKQVAPSLKGLKIRVEGHTDSDPVQHTRGRYPYGNLQLSGMRALEVAHFLIQECGLDPHNVSFAGIGEYDPVASNETKEGKAKNRRVDIRALEVVKAKPRP